VLCVLQAAAAQKGQEVRELNHMLKAWEAMRLGKDAQVRVATTAAASIRQPIEGRSLVTAILSAPWLRPHPRLLRVSLHLSLSTHSSVLS